VAQWAHGPNASCWVQIDSKWLQQVFGPILDAFENQFGSPYQGPTANRQQIFLSGGSLYCVRVAVLYPNMVDQLISPLARPPAPRPPGCSPSARSNTQLLCKHPTTIQAPNYHTSTQLLYKHPITKQAPNYYTSTQLLNKHLPTIQAPNYCTSSE
jgi:hypothetical protein